MSRRARRVLLAILLVGCVVGYFTRAHWKPAARGMLLGWLGVAATASPDHAADEHGHEGHDHAGHDHAGHDHAGHDELNSLELSKQAQANIGLKLGKVELTTFERTIEIPGMVVERPARSTLVITATLTGIVTAIYPIQGEAVRPGQKLFDLRLTHEELVQSQGDFLRVAEELDVIAREIARLERIAADGGIAARQVLERRYEQQNKEAVQRAQYQALLLHGFTEEQIQNILKTRTLLRDLTVAVPVEAAAVDGSPPNAEKVYEIQELRVAQGQSVTAGDALALLADHSELYIEGNAFDKDVDAVNRAVERGWTATAALESDGSRPETIRGLKILYVAGSVDVESRTFHFYLPLPNQRIRDVVQDGGHRFISWRYKPGRRVQLGVPVEQWPERIVLPVEAVAQDGAENYVFTPNGDHFDRRPVHVEYRDRYSVVVAADGSLFPGDAIALSGAQQMQLALKNKAGGAVDPHAGHNH